MKQITGVYETADGKLWRDRKQAERHNAWLSLVEFCGSLGIAWDGAEDDEPAAEHMATDMLASSLELRRILGAEPCEGGGEVDASEDGGAS